MSDKYELCFKVEKYPWKKFDTYSDINDKELLKYHEIYKRKGFKVKVIKITREIVEIKTKDLLN